MNWALFRHMTLAAAALLAVAGCGGAGGGSVAGGGTGGTGISSGTVTGFGSVFVNSVEFDTTNSSVTLDGTSGPDETADPHRGLKVGMVVKVDGEFSDDDIHGSAMEIEYKDNLEGPIDSITPIGAMSKRMVVLGQTVILDINQTHFENTTFDTLAVGNVIEVSGLLDVDGNIQATYVEKKADSFVSGTTEIEVKGAIKNLGATTFQINALTVDYSAATLPSEVLADGQHVEVKGRNYDGVTLTATEVEIDDDTLGATDAAKVQVEGFITSVNSQTEFTVGTQPVKTTSSTVFENCTTCNIAADRKVEVEGSLAGSVLTATKVSFKD